MNSLLIVLFTILMTCTSSSIFLSAQATSSSTINILEYGDETCTGTALVNSSAPTNSCYSGKYASGSGIMNCISGRSSTTSCVKLNYYQGSDRHTACSNKNQLQATSDRVCQSCIQPTDENGNEFQEVICDNRNSETVLIRGGCSPSSSNGTQTQKSQCTNCSSMVKLQVGVCTPYSGDSSGNFILVEKIEACQFGVINVTDFSGTRSCSRSEAKSVSQYLVPNRGCQGGVEFRCN